MTIISKFLSLFLLIAVLAGCSSVSDKNDIYQISGGVDYDPSPNGSTMALVGDSLYYVQSGIKFETNRKGEEYSSRPQEVILSVQARLLSRNTSEQTWKEVANSLETKRISIVLSPEESGVSATIAPAMSLLVHAAFPGYSKPLCIDLGDIAWDDRPKNDWLYGIMKISFHYGPDVICAEGTSVQATYAVPKHEFQVNVRRRINEKQ